MFSFINGGVLQTVLPDSMLSQVPNPSPTDVILGDAVDSCARSDAVNSCTVSGDEKSVVVYGVHEGLSARNAEKLRSRAYHDTWLSKTGNSPTTVHCLFSLAYQGSGVASGSFRSRAAKGKRGKRKGGKRSRRKGDPQKVARDGSTFTQMVPVPASKITQPNNKPYIIVQSVNKGTIVTTSTSAITFSGTYFTFGDIDQSSSLSAVWDQYKIYKIECWITPMLGAQVNTDGYPQWTSVIDYDDANVLTTFAQAGDYTNAVTTTFNESQYRVFTPHVAVASYSGSFTSYNNVTAPWIDMSSTSVQHYGVKGAYLSTGSGSHTINMLCRYHVMLRNVR